MGGGCGMRRDLKYGVLGESPGSISSKAFLIFIALTIIVLAGVVGVVVGVEPQDLSKWFAGFLYFALLIVVMLALLVIIPARLRHL